MCCVCFPWVPGLTHRRSPWEMAIFSEGWDVVGFDGVEPMDAGKAQSGMENLGTFVVNG